MNIMITNALIAGTIYAVTISITWLIRKDKLDVATFLGGWVGGTATLLAMNISTTLQ